MKVPLRWLQEFVELPTVDPDELATALAMIGHEVESYEVLEAAWSDVFVGQVLEIAPHPDADKVRVCQVDSGEGPTQIICGAWNFESGAVVAVARPGAVLPGDVEIGERTIRGVDSYGMICSESELGLGQDHAGILVLDGSLVAGTPLAEVIELPDVVFDLSITPNRGDAMSLLGIARELAAYYDSSWSIPERVMTTVPGATSISIEIDDPKGCWRFSAREIRSVTVKDAPLSIRHRLHKAGIRSISNVVDATNYVMIELGQPLHAFDVDSIVGSKLVVSRAEPGERLVTLDGVDRALDEDDLIIRDALGPTSMAGTMGGERSEVSPTTTGVLMEAATWDPPTIMYMSRRHGLRSEASTRFERGVDPLLADMANRRASALVADWSGGEILEGSVDAVAREHAATTLELSLSSIERLLGPGFASSYVTEILSRLGMKASGGDPLSVEVPSYRVDITRPVDLVEEVARIHGFDKFPSTLALGIAGSLTIEQRRERLLSQTLARAGLSQATTLPFVGEGDMTALEMDSDIETLVRVKNPLRDEEARLRPSMLPGLLNALRYNVSHGNASLALFELGLVFRAVPDTFDARLPQQTRRVAWAMTGDFGPGVIGVPGLSADSDTSLALFRLVANTLQLTDYELRQATAPGYHPGRTAVAESDGRLIGFVGQLSPAAARHFDLPEAVGIAELDLEALIAPVGLVQSSPPSVFPFVDFDLSFVIPISLPVAGLQRVIARAAGSLLESAAVFDEFRGEDLKEDTKAVAIHYRLRASDRTLTGDEAQRVRQAMIDAAASVGARLRGA